MSVPKQHGILVISLDFELYWGMRDVRRLEDTRATILGERRVVPALLTLFQEYGIHATWAIVGFMFCESQEDLLQDVPTNKPRYTNPALSPYPYLEEVGRDEQEDPFHYAPSLIKLVASSPNQEVASHTFSHYYCLEQGQDVEAFREDLKAAKNVAKRYEINLESLVFPRNQFNSEYLTVCKELGFTAYRGNERSWMYRAKSRAHESFLQRGGRLLDAYVNVSGHNCSSLEEIRHELPVNIPSSRFLRPVSRSRRILEPLRLRRILSGLTHAAQHRLIYHLWWHPHNFGDQMEANLSFLRKIMNHYATLKKAYGMQSLNMGEIARMSVTASEHRSRGEERDREVIFS